jgi:hypothetical protein
MASERAAMRARPDVGLVRGRVLIDLACEKSSSERSVGNEADAELFDRRQHFRFSAAGPEGVFALRRRYPLDRR